MSMGELFFIGVIILLVVPPEKLPGLAREAARLLNEIRRSTSGVWEELKKDVPNPMADLRKQKQEVDDYLKFIGSPADHKNNHAATPASAPVNSQTESKPIEVATSAPPSSTFANKPTFVITPSSETTPTAEQKNESDPTKKQS